MSRFRGGRQGLTSGRGVTQEHDRIRVYGRRRMPRRKKARWVRFKKKVFSVAEKELGLQTVMFNQKIDFKNDNSAKQTLGWAALYSWFTDDTTSAKWSHLRDLRRIAHLSNRSDDPTRLKGNYTTGHMKMYFTTGVLDITLQNLSFINQNPASETTLDPNCTLEVDIYEMVSKRKWFSGVTTYKDPEAAFDYNPNVEIGMWNAGEATPAESPEIWINKRGATPFELGTAVGKWGIKILKKTKIYLKSNQVFTYQIRDPKRRVIRFNEAQMGAFGTGAQEKDGPNKPGWTRWVFFIAKAVPSVTVGSTYENPQATTEKLKMGITRKYAYRIEGLSDARTAYNPTEIGA